jgi:toxin ParE1/3/4
MIKFQVLLTEQASIDLKRIFEYVALTLLEPEIAAKLIAKLEHAILSLDEMPERFRLFEREPWHSIGLRQMPVENFLVFYIPKLDDQTVTVIRIMYARRNINEQLFN